MTDGEKLDRIEARVDAVAGMQAQNQRLLEKIAEAVGVKPFRPWDEKEKPVEPNRELEHIRKLCTEIIRPNNNSPIGIIAKELAGKVLDLDESLGSGGDFPRDWKPF